MGKAGFFLLIIFASILACGTSRKAAANVDLSKFEGEWYGTDYDSIFTEEGDTVLIGSTLTVHPDDKSISLECIGPPFMSRIASFRSTLDMTGPCAAVFRFEDDGWGNRGSGRIDFSGGVIEVDIKIEDYANSDMRIFEGPEYFSR